jgi:alpha-2-macroglobulin
MLAFIASCQKPYMGKRFFSTCACLLVCLFFCQAQSNTAPEVWKNIETAIHQQKELGSTLKQLETIENDAKNNENPVELARSLCYMMLIRDIRTEDSLYFRNSSYMDSMLLGETRPELKLLMHYLEAQRLWRFRTKYLKFNRARYETKNALNNYAAFTNEQLDSSINYHFEKAKQLVDSLDLKDKREWSIENILWLSSSPLTFLFKPTLKDIIWFEQITAIKGVEERTFPPGLNLKEWLSCSQKQMIDTLSFLKERDRLKGSTVLYVGWMEDNKEKPAVYYFIETLFRESLYRSFYGNYNLEYQRAYEAYLKSIQSSIYPEVKARGVYQLSFLWKSWADRYSGANYGYGGYQESFDTTFRKYAADVLGLYEKNKPVFDNYFSLRREMEGLKAAIVSPKLEIRFPYENERAKPLLVKVQYRNLPTFFYRIVKLRFDEEPRADKQYLLAHPTVEEQKVELPLPPDYNPHRTLLRLAPLPAGRYCLVFSDSLLDETRIFKYQSFVVTDIAILHSNRKVFALSRSTGMPLKAAIVNATPLQKQTIGLKETRTSQSGSFDFRGTGRYKLMASYRGDTLSEEIALDKTEPAEDVYSRDDYDGIVDFYDENSKVMVFTDRGIYRPGQKVFYKAILVTKNPRTGELMIMNKEHLKKGFRNYLKKWQKEMEPLLYLTDPFGRKIDSISVKPDEYGSISGHFTIPVNAATGEWSIEPDYLDTYEDNDGSFQVEEYKRPSFELSVEKPSKNYRIRDTLDFSIKVKSFAGSVFEHTAVKYRIEREASRGVQDIDEKTVIDSIQYTDENGKLEIRFFDHDLQLINRSNDVSVVYNLSAEVTDLAGESHDVNASLRLSTRPVNIRIPLSNTLDLADLMPLLINAKDNNGVSIQSELQVQLYRVSNPKGAVDEDLSGYADQWIYSPEQLQGWFPNYRFLYETGAQRDELVFQDTINTANFDKFRWPVSKLMPGKYKLVVSAYDEGFLSGDNSRSFSVFDSRSKEVPVGDKAFFFLPTNFPRTGEMIQVFSGSSFDTTYTIRQVKYYSKKDRKNIVVQYFNEYRQKGIHEWKWKIPDDASEKMSLSELFIAGNKLYKHEEEIIISSPKNSQPEIVVEQFRSQLYPGAKTTNTVSVKTKDENTAAALMTTIYDASLDKLADHRWRIPAPERYKSIYSNWPHSISSQTQAELSFLSTHVSSFNERPVWWMDSVTYLNRSEGYLDGSQMLEGRVPGISITNAAGLEDVVVVAYDTKRSDMTVSSAFIKVRGFCSLEEYKQPLIILDGVPYPGELSSINVNEITAAVVLKGAEALALYGSGAAEGVLIISTKGEIVLPIPKKEPELKVRSNFNETAFFSPAIHADKKGFYTFSYTMPESVTEWDWKLFAHTKAAQFMYAERKLVTQLPLMIQPHLPASIYQGDKIILKSRVSNLDTLVQNGTVSCNVEDALTGEELGQLALTASKKSFSLTPRSTESASFELVVPEGQQHPLKITITARSDAFADGEEHIIPVLSKRIFVKKNQSIHLTGPDTLIALPHLAGMSSLYGVELSIEAKPQAALLYSLPFLTHYSFDCAEQMFNKLFAYVVAVGLVRTDTALQQLIRSSRIFSQSNFKEKTPDSLIEQSMPWLAMGEKARREQAQLAELLDTMKSNSKIETYFEKLFELQNTDGGISWFKGGESDNYISLYILAGLGRINNIGWRSLSKYGSVPDRLEKFVEKLVKYSESNFLQITNTGGYEVLWFAYARSFWIKEFPVREEVRLKIKSSIEKAREGAKSLQSKALLVTTALRFFSTDSAEARIAMQELQSLREAAIVDENGIRWKAIADGDELGTTAEETLALLVEAFKAGDEEKAIAPGIIKWLLSNKSDQPWRTTKGTAATIDLLLKEQRTTVGRTHTVTALIAGKPKTVSDDPLSGSISAFQKTENEGEIQIKNEGSETVHANLGWYFFTKPEQLSELNAGVHVTKRWYLMNPETHNWENADSATFFKIGDKLKVVIGVESAKALRYVWINDKRSAAFEPREYSSGYRNGKYFGYYQSIRDDGIDFFAEFIPSGKTELEYDLVVAQEGQFCGGLAMLQCMYKPSITSYSEVGVVKVQ